MPARAGRLIAALKECGVEVTKPKSGGSHWKARKAGYRPYSIPMHNKEKTEIADRYIRGVCRAFDIDEAELKKKL